MADTDASPRRRQSTLDPSSPSLRPPLTPTSPSNRNSFGLWGGSKSAASTPNLTQTVGHKTSTCSLDHNSETCPSPLPSMSSVPLSQGSGVASATSIDSHGSNPSFQQRRKRSESIGGIKNAAGNLGRMVRKTSSNFLKKLTKNFDDRDLPPNPLVPETTETLPDPALPDVPPAQKSGPLDTPPPLSPLLDGHEFDHHLYDLVSAKQTITLHTPEQTSHSAESTDSEDNSKDHDMNAFNEEGQGIDQEQIETSIANRLSRLYDGGSIHLNQSETSLYYSTKSTLSDDNDLASKRASYISQEALGYGLGLSRGNSIRLSKHLATHLSNTAALSSHNPTGVESALTSPARGRVTMTRRPVSMFTSLTPTTFNPLDSDGKDSKPSAKDLDPPLEVDDHAAKAGESLGSLLGQTLGRSMGGRPMTICVSSEDRNSRSGIGSDPATDRAFEAARRCYQEDEDFVRREGIATYLGTPKPFQRQVLSHYMDHFDFSGKRLDLAFRSLCQKLVLKGESQEVDRVLEQFARRYVEGNPRSILGPNVDVVHAVTYSILLLNTDLHIVQQSSKMSRSAFVKNTLQAVQAQQSQTGNQPVEHLNNYNHPRGRSRTMGEEFVRRPAAKDDLDLETSQAASRRGSVLGLSRTLTGDSLVSPTGPSSSTGGSKKRSPSVKSWKSGQSLHSHAVNSDAGGVYGSKMGLDPKANGGFGNGKWWHGELETLLKDIYSAVKSHQILLPIATTTPTSPTTSSFTGPTRSLQWQHQPHPSSSLSSESGSLGHFGGSTNQSMGSGSTGFSFGFSGRRNSVSARTRQLRNDAMQRLNAQAQVECGLSPSVPSSHSTARYSIAGSILNETMVLDKASKEFKDLKDRQGSPLSASSPKDLTRLRSAGGISSNSQSTLTSLASSTTPSASQNSLASLQSPASSVTSSKDDVYEKLAGYQDLQQLQQVQLRHESRYRMEGILWRKHLLERGDKKAQHRTWRQLLVVIDIDQATLSMFRATAADQAGISKSTASPLNDDQGTPLFDEISLQHTITNILPPPGYSSSRRHVFAIQLFTGAVYLFQANNALECEAWARSCNYWAARTSKEPLVGGVVNMEYGWGRALEMLQQQEDDDESELRAEGGSLTTTPSAVTPEAGGSSASTDYLNYPHTSSSVSSSNSNARSGTGQTSLRRPSSGKGSKSASIKSATKGSGSSGPTSNVPLGDRVALFEWTAPLPTMTMAVLSEEEQMLALQRYVIGLEAEMEVHQEHRVPMMRLFLPRSQNYTKAFNNWEHRSRHLLKDMVKYQVYVECLEQSLLYRQQLLSELNKDHRAGTREKMDEEVPDLEAELEGLVVHDEPTSITLVDGILSPIPIVIESPAHT